MDAYRVPRTLLIQVFYTSPSPDKAATVANAFADAYLVDQLDANPMPPNAPAPGSKTAWPS